MGYQPTATHPGERACVDRYQSIKRVLAMLPQPFTLLDFGANAGYFARAVAQDFDCIVTAIDDHRDLPAIASERITVIPRRMAADGFRRLPRHEVVLALSVLHHVRDWRAMLFDLRACRQFLIVEVPDPGERWMRSAAARHELAEIRDAVAGLASTRLGVFPRTGRDGSQHNRPMFLIPGSLTTLTGIAFSGSGTCSRKLTSALHARGLDKHLGYQPYPGSLNLRLGVEPDLGAPVVDWPGTVKGRKRPYQFWPAWIEGTYPCHAMIPGARGHGPNHVELVAPVRLRGELGINDGDVVNVEVACGS
jgi:hypothetical protein